MKACYRRFWVFSLLWCLSSGAADSYKIAVVPKGSTHDFWKAIHAGAVKAQRELQGQGTMVEILWKGPLREDDRDQQIQTLENFIGKRVNGIIVAPLDSKALVAPVETAVKSKIPVVVVDSALETPVITSYIATDNFKGGQLAADALGGLLAGKGNVILLRHQTGSASTEQREAGFLSGIAKKFPGIKVISSDQHSGPTRDTAYRVSQNLLNRFGKDVNGIFTANESSTAGMVLALKDAGKGGGKVKLVGFDSSSALLGAIQQNDLQAIVVQDPFQMGYLGVRTIVGKLQGSPAPAKIDTTLMVVTPVNLAQPDVQKLVKPPLDEYLK
jgi:ribose transport system substrate-binding protein